MNFSKPCGVVGGGEMNFATSSVDSIDSSDIASVFTSSRSISRWPLSTGSIFVQSPTAAIGEGADIGTASK